MKQRLIYQLNLLMNILPTDNLMQYIVITVIFSTRGTAFISGHADGSIVRYIITEGSSTEQQVNLLW